MKDENKLLLNLLLNLVVSWHRKKTRFQTLWVDKEKETSIFTMNELANQYHGITKTKPSWDQTVQFKPILLSFFLWSKIIIINSTTDHDEVYIIYSLLGLVRT